MNAVAESGLRWEGFSTQSGTLEDVFIHLVGRLEEGSMRARRTGGEPMNLPRVAAYFPAFAKGYLRNPLGLFMSLIFPIILILIFGAVFSNSGVSAVPLTVQHLDGGSAASQQLLAALNATGAVSITLVSPSVGNLSACISHHSRTAGLVIPAGFGAALANHTPVLVLVYTNPPPGRRRAD